MTPSTIVRPADPELRRALRLAAGFAAVKLLLHFAMTLWSSHLGYGYFRDEFYYIACGRHLAWGYVDHGPLVAVQARLGEMLFGDSVFAIRILSAVAGALAIFLTGLLTFALGGRRPAQALAMIGLLGAGVYLGLDGFLSMNSVEPFFWMTCTLAILWLLRGASPLRWWALFGLSAGLGLLNKPSMTFFLVALGAGLLLTPQRKVLFTRYAAFGIALLVLIALPNVFWQMHHHWPTLEFLRDLQSEGRVTLRNPLQFFLAQLLQMGPLNALLWLTGIFALLRAHSVRDTRWLGYTFLIFFAIMCKLHAKEYYLAPIYPSVFAGGAIAWEDRFRGSRGVARNRIFAFPALESVLIVVAVVTLPAAAPVLRPDPWVRYTSALHLVPGKSETTENGPLPQFFADRFGWNEQVAAVTRIANSLSPTDRANAGILTSNYGEAAALEFLGHDLPPVISGHNNYWLWGPRGRTNRLLIVISGNTLQHYRDVCRSAEIAARVDHPLAMPHEHKNIYLVRDCKPEYDPTIAWADFKHFD